MSTKKKEKIVQKEKAPTYICPYCGNIVEGHKCRICGAIRTVNPVSKHVIWMKNGRVLAAFNDEKSAYTRMAEKYGIPKEKWPKEFR